MCHHHMYNQCQSVTPELELLGEHHRAKTMSQIK